MMLDPNRATTRSSKRQSQAINPVTVSLEFESGDEVPIKEQLGNKYKTAAQTETLFQRSWTLLFQSDTYYNAEVDAALKDLKQFKNCDIFVTRKLPDISFPIWHRARIYSIDDQGLAKVVIQPIQETFVDKPFRCLESKAIQLQLLAERYGDVQAENCDSIFRDNPEQDAPSWLRVVKPSDYKIRRRQLGKMQLLLLLIDIGRVETDVPGDGHCGYNSTARQAGKSPQDVKDDVLEGSKCILELLTSDCLESGDRIMVDNLLQQRGVEVLAHIIKRIEILETFPKERVKKLEYEYWFGGADSTDFIALSFLYNRLFCVVSPDIEGGVMHMYYPNLSMKSIANTF
jgi:hypothetical protein